MKLGGRRMRKRITRNVFYKFAHLRYNATFGDLTRNHDTCIADHYATYKMPKKRTPSFTHLKPYGGWGKPTVGGRLPDRAAAIAGPLQGGVGNPPFRSVSAMDAARSGKRPPPVGS